MHSSNAILDIAKTFHHCILFVRHSCRPPSFLAGASSVLRTDAIGGSRFARQLSLDHSLVSSLHRFAAASFPPEGYPRPSPRSPHHHAAVARPTTSSFRRNDDPPIPRATAGP